SFFVDLLPMLEDGRGPMNFVRRTEGWRSRDNLKAGAFVIPAFLDPSYPRTSFRAAYPSAPGNALGGTHYVGSAGAGLAAAGHGPKGQRRRQGSSGYNRQVRTADVTDGLANTIYMFQVPPAGPGTDSPPRAWIAGGGTLQGVPEKDSLKPFVYNHGGKKGTYVLMADGSVRFRREGTSDDVVKALVTIRGGESVSADSAGERVPVPEDAGKPRARPPVPTAPVEASRPAEAAPAADWKELAGDDFTVQ